MDLDDSFTEKLLQRNKARKQYLSAKQNETPDGIAKKYSVLIEEQQIATPSIPEESPKRLCEENIDDSPKRQCIEKYEGSPSRQWPPPSSRRNVSEKENAPLIEEPFIPVKSADSARGLAALRKKANIGSNNRLTSEAEVNNPPTYVFSTNSHEIRSGPKKRLANLAADINQWEDDLHKPTLSSNNVPFISSKASNINSYDTPTVASNSETICSKDISESNMESVAKGSNFGTGVLDSNSTKVCMLSPSKKGKAGSNSLNEKNPRKIDVWNEAIEATLGIEESKKPPSKEFKAINEKWKNMAKNVCNNNNNNTASFLSKKKIKLFEQEEVKSDLNRSFDPTDLPLSARKAIFEQASRDTIEKSNQQSCEPKLSVAQRAALFENASKTSSDSKPITSCKSKFMPSPQSSPSKPAKVNVSSQNSPLKYLPSPQKAVASPKKAVENIKVASDASPVKKLNTDTRAVEQMLLTRVNSIASSIEPKVQPTEESVKGKIQLVNYWENLSSSSKSVNSNSEEEYSEKCEAAESDSYSDEEYDGYESETESKYERESEAESNFHTDMTENYSESEQESDVPLEQNVFKSPVGLPPLSSTAKKTFELNKSPSLKSPVKTSSWNEANVIEDSCDATSLSDCNSYDGSVASSDIRLNEKLQSYSGSSSSVGSSYDPETSKESEENFVTKGCSESNSDTPLLHTVSFYRKQRQGTRTPPLKTIIRREQVSTPTTSNHTEAIQEQIKLFQEEILKQTTIISQTSQALNLCHATTEFSGSAEQVEGERLLLIATQKRQALINEIQRLKAHGAEGDSVIDGTGTLTISDLQLPLKQEFLAAQLEGRINDAVHWFLCLIRHGAQVIVTQMVSTDDKINNGALCFTNYVKLQNLPPDFSVVFEVYALQTKKERLPHDKKYHIKRDKSTLRITPKGKKSDGKLLLPAISSPGGPNAVRSPSFGVIGFTRFTIQNCNKKCFTLDKIPFTSPLEGVLRVKLHLHAEHKVMEKGFLTMFEDVSGFGAWHRRWCALNAQYLTYWKYPDDEQKKEPIGSIDLKQCVTGQIKPVSRDVCARAHTFELVTVRPQVKGDKNSLITQCSNTVTTTKHLLSADTKEERILWCNKLNEALTNVRKWNPQALRPVEGK